MVRKALVRSMLLAAISSIASAATTVNQQANRIDLTFDNGTKLSLAVKDGELLGLQSASVRKVALKSDQTVVRPVLVQEYDAAPVAWERIRVREVKTEGDAVQVVCDLGQTPVAEAWPRVFVMAGDKPHRDYYLFPHVRLPSEINRIDSITHMIGGTGAFTPAGTLTWTFEPATMNVGGWTWQGWKHRYTFDLGQKKVNVIRELGTWETGGNAVGATLVNLRYRGLGGIVNKLSPMEGNATSTSATFTTTEIIPGAVDKAPVVSPAVPGPQNIGGREEAMKYRHGAWIAQPQRGGGVNWIDYQYRPDVALAMFYERMEAVRSVQEIFPGDSHVSHTDCLYFPLTSTHTTVPKLHLALVTRSDPLAEHESRTRWQEMDDHVRQLIADELRFVRHDPMPSVGMNIDSGWLGRIKQIDAGAKSLAEVNVRRLLVHHPGWLNGRGLRQKETPFEIPQRLLTDPKKPGEPAKLSNDTGGDCSIHDYVPQSPQVRDAWVQLTTDLKALDIEYWAWVTGMVYGTGPVVEQFGEARFTRNAPGVDFSSGYPGSNGRAGHRGIPITDPAIRDWWLDRVKSARNELGVAGFWADSFQNMFMSQMNYQRDDWSPNVRAWWEVVSQHTRDGLGWMSESTGFPSLSCSIEVGGNPHDFEGVWWTLPYVTRWYRGEHVPHKGTPQADRLYFRSLANKGPVAPGLSFGPYTGDAVRAQIPKFGEYSMQYLAALPKMKRPFQLPDDRGVLWLELQGDDRGVLFSFIDQPLPEGVVATPVGTEQKSDSLKTEQTYLVSAADLIKAFGLRRGDQADPRIKK